MGKAGFTMPCWNRVAGEPGRSGEPGRGRTGSRANRVEGERGRMQTGSRAFRAAYKSGRARTVPAGGPGCGQPGSRANRNGRTGSRENRVYAMLEHKTWCQPASSECIELYIRVTLSR